MDLAQHYIETALKGGALHAIRFEIDDIAFDSRTLLKCAFGCKDFELIHTCPLQKVPLMPWDYERILKRYKWGVLIHSADKYVSQKCSFAIEKQAFGDGFYFAFSMCDCICKECARAEGKPCRTPDRARPAFHSVGIDIFATAHKFGLPIETIRNYEKEPNWYSAVFVE